MPEVAWALLCDQAIIDKDSNSISLMSIIEEVGIQIEFGGDQRPVPGEWFPIPQRISLVVLFVRSDRNTPEAAIQGKVTLTGPSGEDFSQPITFELDLSNFARLRSITILPAMPYQGQGMYKFGVHLQDRADASWSKVASAEAFFSETVQPPASPIDYLGLMKGSPPIRRREKPRKRASSKAGRR